VLLSRNKNEKEDKESIPDQLQLLYFEDGRETETICSQETSIFACCIS
jgi:hypothetical protein